MRHLQPGSHRSASLHSQYLDIKEVAGLPRPRTTQIEDPQIHSTEERDGMSRHRGTSLPESEDLLWEVLLRLPPKPSSLPHASAVCKRWRRIVTDPTFLRCFYAHHRKPPLLGVFNSRFQFTSLLDPPDRIPPQRFDFSRGRHSSTSVWNVEDCRHGRVLLRADGARDELVVCDLITTKKHRVAIPPEFTMTDVAAAVLCADQGQGHVHGCCHSSPFKLVLVNSFYNSKPFASVTVYSSETAIWGNIISVESPCKLWGTYSRGSLVGNALYWWVRSINQVDILAFDLDDQSLAVISGLAGRFGLGFNIQLAQIIHSKNGTLGVAIWTHRHVQMWQRNVNSHGVAIWVMWKTIELHNILGFSRRFRDGFKLLGYSEDTDTFLIYVNGNVYMIQLKSMECKRVDVDCSCFNNQLKYYPVMSFYPPGRTITGAEMLGNVVNCKASLV